MVESSPPLIARTVRVPDTWVVHRPALFQLLSAGATGGVVLVSAPAGSGKTVLLQSWIQQAGLRERTAWVSVDRGEDNPQHFWRRMVEALRAAANTDALLDELTPTPEFDGNKVVARLVSGLSSLHEPVVLVIDNVHELASREAQAQLEVLIAERPPLLHIVLSTRRDPQLGLHRLRLAGQLAEVRASDLRFTLEETRELLAASGITLSGKSIEALHERTEGWAAGLRLAAISLARHPEPERFIAEFSGSERTVTEYLLAEVLERQPAASRRLLLRTSILDQVNSALADVLVGEKGSERILQALEDENAFVVSLDAPRSRFRYHHLFADLLHLELRRLEPDVIPELHRAAAQWYAERGHVVDAVRHAQAAGDWANASRLLAEHILSLMLNGEGATIGALLAAFPAAARSDPELATVFATVQLFRGSLDDAVAYLALAERRAADVPDKRRRHFEFALAFARQSLARRRGDFGAVTGEIERFLDAAEPETGDIALSNDARAFALTNLGIVELWSFRLSDAQRHLEEGLQLGSRSGRPYVEMVCLSHLALAAGRRSLREEREKSAQALAVAEAHGWASEPSSVIALTTMASLDVWQGRFEEAQRWLDRVEEAIRPGPELESAPAVLVHLSRGLLQLARGRLQQALAAFREAGRLETTLVTPHAVKAHTVQFLVHALHRMGDKEGARAALAALSDDERQWGEARVAFGSLELADGNAPAAIEAVAPVADGSIPVLREYTVIRSLLVDALARDLLGDQKTAEADVERALDLAEPDRLIFPFVLAPVRDLLERHPRQQTAHASLLADILDVLAGSPPPPPTRGPTDMRDGLSESELRVLRHLPSNLSAPEIAAQLFLSTSTVKTHMRHIYGKFGAHGRTEAVEHARQLGLLAPSVRGRR